MITFMVLDTEYRDYQIFATEEEAREFIRFETEWNTSPTTLRLFRRQELEIAQ